MQSLWCVNQAFAAQSHQWCTLQPVGTLFTSNCFVSDGLSLALPRALYVGFVPHLLHWLETY